MSLMYSRCIAKLACAPRVCYSRLRLLDSGTLKLLSGNQRIADFDAELAAELTTIHQQCPSQVPPVPRLRTTSAPLGYHSEPRSSARLVSV